MVYIAFAMVVLGGLATAAYLAVHGHVWLALFVLIIISGCSTDDE